MKENIEGSKLSFSLLIILLFVQHCLIILGSQFRALGCLLAQVWGCFSCYSVLWRCLSYASSNNSIGMVCSLRGSYQNMWCFLTLSLFYDGQSICLSNGPGSETIIVQVPLTWTSFSFSATQASGAQLAQNESLDSASTTGQSFSSTVSPKGNTSASGTPGKDWKHALSFSIQAVKRMQIILSVFFICCALWWGPHLLIHVGYTVSMSPSPEVVLSDGWTSKHSVEIRDVITGGYKLQ